MVIRKILNRLKYSIYLVRNFGFYIGFMHVAELFVKYLPCNIKQSLIKKKHNIVKGYLKKYYSIDIKSNENNKYDFTVDNLHGHNTIWFCWLQGKDQMTELVKLCYENICKKKLDYKLIFVSLENFANYVELPEHVISKYKSGLIRHAHFADILRTALLYKYGGIWVDSTLYITKEIPSIIPINLNFYSIKQPEIHNFISSCRWSNFFLYCKAGNKIMKYVLESLYKYLENEDSFIDYFLMDYFIDLCYENDIECKKYIDEIPFNNINVHKLTPILNLTYNKNNLVEVSNNTCIFKLSNKIKFNKYTSNNKLTNYGYIFENVLKYETYK